MLKLDLRRDYRNGPKMLSVLLVPKRPSPLARIAGPPPHSTGSVHPKQQNAMLAFQVLFRKASYHFNCGHSEGVCRQVARDGMLAAFLTGGRV